MLFPGLGGISSFSSLSSLLIDELSLFVLSGTLPGAIPSCSCCFSSSKSQNISASSRYNVSSKFYWSILVNPLFSKKFQKIITKIKKKVSKKHFHKNETSNFPEKNWKHVSLQFCEISGQFYNYFCELKNLNIVNIFVSLFSRKLWNRGSMLHGPCMDHACTMHGPPKPTSLQACTYGRCCTWKGDRDTTAGLLQ